MQFSQTTRNRRRFAASGAWLSAITAVAILPLVLTGTASAAPVQLADKSTQTVSDDGWNLSLTANELTVDSVPNLATTPFTREGFVSAKVTGRITGEGTVPVKTGYIEQGLQIGCQVDVSSGLAVGLGFSIGPTAGVTISGIPGANLGVSASVSPSIQTTLVPGTITTVPLGKKNLEGSRGSIDADAIHVKIDACYGPVTVRTYAQLSVSTPTADNSLFVYSDPTWL
ncbi:MAG: MspA family porin [Rhodococcus sp. (in: high G+C Gram-positive bacteria)]|uniref:MspA family porin n=1 Tax=Rhodococcus sp. SBT000017 TaxID=1803385 RepID=UPI000EF8F68C|nr:MspA family porin [Rhodococcus sp. SBT000017]RMB78100.1 hypothetical protein AYK61_18270 [Rhodococcus sp. SBT000017]